MKFKLFVVFITSILFYFSVNAYAEQLNLDLYCQGTKYISEHDRKIGNNSWDDKPHISTWNINIEITIKKNKCIENGYRYKTIEISESKIRCETKEDYRKVNTNQAIASKYDEFIYYDRFVILELDRYTGKAIHNNITRIKGFSNDDK